MINETIEQKTYRILADLHKNTGVIPTLEDSLKDSIFLTVRDALELAIAEEREANKIYPLEPTDEMRDAGARRLVKVESDTDWPKKFTALQRSGARNDAERVWRSMWLAAPKDEVSE